jgi:hypothetical protein
LLLISNCNVLNRKKSLLIKILELILQDRCVHITLEHLLNPFERSRIQGAWLVIVSEVEELVSDTRAGALKAYIGRDSIPYQVKYQQSGKSDSFVFSGVFCFISNKEMEDIFPADEALYSRFLRVTFPHTVADSQNIDTQKDLPVIINQLIIWALIAPESIFRDHVRSGDRGKALLDKYNYLVEFISTHFSICDPQASVSTVDIKRLHGLWAKENNVSRRECDIHRIKTILKTGPYRKNLKIIPPLSVQARGFKKKFKTPL